MKRLSIAGIRKTFGTKPVISGMDLDVDDGEFVVLVGPSGCGKSTLLRIIAGLETADQGTIMLDGVRIDELQPPERKIAMVFQNYALYPHLSVRDNLAFGLTLAKMPKDQIAARIDETARFLEIKDLLEFRPSQLSGGQKQRVALGRAVIRDPKLYLFDEPLSNLDAHLRLRMRSEILRLHRSKQATSIYVTHDQTEAMTLADRIAVVHEGRILQVGTPQSLYDRPGHRFVAEFLGSPGMGIGPAKSFTSEDPLLWGVRPEHLRFTNTEPCNHRLGSATVTLIEHTGDQHLVHLLTEDHLHWVAKLDRQAGGVPELGKSVSLYSNPAHIHFFRSSDQTRIESPLMSSL
jgi:ABC-type sugar transport system ATPase subunit